MASVSSAMSVLQIYLSNPRVRSTLSKKPGDQGFSLIELVVVVAVLAILAAVAIPAFTSINDKAAVAAAQNTLAQIVKECAVKKANMETEEFNVPNLNSFELGSALNEAGTAGDCDGTESVIRLDTKDGANNILPPYIAINVDTGEKTCAAGSEDTEFKFCSAAVGIW